MGNVSDKCRENQNKHFVFSGLFLENPAVNEKMRINYSRARPATDDNMAFHAGYLRL